LEAAIIADYDAQSTVERELVLRLASLLWRLRRATTMETGLFEIQAGHLREFRQASEARSESLEIISAIFGMAGSADFNRASSLKSIRNGVEILSSCRPGPIPSPAHFARCFLRLANLPSCALDRISRYEAILWRQVAQILFALHALDRRKPQERRRRFFAASRQEPRFNAPENA